MVKKHWFYKTLFSYLPIFFIMSSILFLIFFLAYSENIKKTTLKANAVFSEQVNQAVDNYLRPIDQLITTEMVVGDTFRNFFNEEKSGTYAMYEISNKIKSLILSFPTTTMYVFRQSDQLIISDNMITDLDHFSDREFVIRQFESTQTGSWTGRRIYQDQKKLEPVPVVSLVRKVPFNTGEHGLIVVNTSVESIRQLVVKMSSQETNYVSFFDRNNDFLFSSDDGRESQSSGSIKHLTQIKSPYSGWEIRSGIKNGEKYAFFAAFPYVWVSLGFISIVVGSLLVIYVTRRNYRPIEALMNRINGVFIHRNHDLFAHGGNQDELRFIGMAIDKLLEQSNRFQDQYKQDLIHIRRNFFVQLLEGTPTMSPEDCQAEMKRLGCCGDFEHVSFGVLEIDKYAMFCKTYSDRDQYLLKFVLNSVVQEIAQSLKMSIWTEWTNNSQLGVIYLFRSDNDNEQERRELVLQLCRKVIGWVEENLKFTITFGNGGEADHIAELPYLHEDALEALKYKPVLGHLHVINHWELIARPKLEIFHHVQLIRLIAQSFRLGEETWKSRLEQFFYELKLGLFPKEDIASLIHYLIYYLDREVVELSEPIRNVWKEDAMPVLSKMPDELETLEEFQARITDVLLHVERQIGSLRESKLNHELIHEVKKYIGDHFANPDLSLTHLSDEFKLSPRYLSRLFKDEFGEKFVDYLLRVRIEHAQKLLRDTEEAVHEIAQKVGYSHSFSFIRVFKRAVGITPGDFRK